MAYGLKASSCGSNPTTLFKFEISPACDTNTLNGSQLAKMKKSIPDMPLSWNL